MKIDIQLNNVILGERELTIDDVQHILIENYQVKIAKACEQRVIENFRFLTNFCRKHIVYGVNTGFGPMSQHIIPASNRRQLQTNLIRSHASGHGELYSEMEVRAVLLARLVSLSQGVSGVHLDTLVALTKMINNEIYPCIYEHGGVGASGDLVQLAHLALALIGEGKVRYSGNIMTAAEVLSKCDIIPVHIHLREGLALINGTSAMTGLGLLNVINARKLLQCNILLCAMLNEIMEAYDDHHAEVLNKVKKHKAQSDIAQILRSVLSGSKRTRKRYQSAEMRNNGSRKLEEKLQEYYSIRCVPQILGPIKDTIDHCETVLVNELNSANDNPIIDHVSGNVYHGGNFHGDFVSLEMDKLKIAVTKLTMLCERQINFLMNDKLNNRLPPFINLGVLGLNFGMQGLQFTATSTTAECQSLSFPMYVHSIPTNNDNQDIVSMGANAAMLTRKVISNGYEVTAIGLMAACQAIDYLKIHDAMADRTKAGYEKLRSIVKKIEVDEPRHDDIKRLTDFLFMDAMVI